ncbi:MAG: asparaginase [Gemmatimonadota bacterium]
MSEARVEVRRGAIVESVHRVSVAVVDAGGRMRARAGAPERITFARSAIKPIQALPLVEDGVLDRFEFGDRELALACASHSGEPRHVDTALAILRRIGVDPSMLACGPHAPFHEPSARALIEAGREPSRVHNNCSGKHAGMLALACHHGWPALGYEQILHPVQQRMLEGMAAWSGVVRDEIGIGVDGCGVATFALPLDALARAFGALAGAARRGEPGPERVLRAMGRYPEYVAGTGRLCTQLSRAVHGRIVAKVGAEGVYCAAVPGAELGIALKVEDGAWRAAEPALLAVLRALTLISDDEVGQLDRFAEPVVTNTRGERVGGLRAVIRLEPCRE